MTAPISGMINARVEPTPYRDDPPHAVEFYQALGMFVVAWGRFETNFVATLLVASGLSGGEIICDSVPISWKRRADIWRKLFKNIPELASYQTHAQDLITAVMNSISDRHVAVHGGWREFIPGPELAAKALSIRPEGINSRMVLYRVTVSKLHAARADANRFNQALAPIIRYLSVVRPAPPDVHAL